MSFAHKSFQSPLGRLKVVANERALVAVLWENDDPSRVRLSSENCDGPHPILDRATEQLLEYFRGARTHFDLPLEFHGTDFQKKVWNALGEIPFGETRSYVEIARRVGSPQASRAVGAANGRNPISIVTPCHRVIGADGKLTGFAGGMEAKSFLLKLEAGN